MLERLAGHRVVVKAPTLRVWGRNKVAGCWTAQVIPLQETEGQIEGYGSFLQNRVGTPCDHLGLKGEGDSLKSCKGTVGAASLLE
jgi:hypothetical protein